eukprot:9500506-Pyramimonas_sp.AAC.5
MAMANFDKPKKKFKKKTIGVRPVKKVVSDTSVAGVKKQIRSLERMLKRTSIEDDRMDGLPEEIRKRMQEQLDSLQGKKTDAFAHKRAEKYERIYKHIRFFGASLSHLASVCYAYNGTFRVLPFASRVTIGVFSVFMRPKSHAQYRLAH